MSPITHGMIGWIISQPLEKRRDHIWPINKSMYEFSPPFQWELDRWPNLLVTAICIGAVVFFGIRKKRTIVEIFSVRVDNVLS